jgi:hypothetical protein
VNGRNGSIFDDQPTVILLILSGCLEFFRWQVCIVSGGDFQWNTYNPVQKKGAKIIDVTRSALFYFISSRELHWLLSLITGGCTDKSGGTLEPFVD